MASLNQAMELALVEARKFVGATAPNPAVGATLLDGNGEVLAVAAHERAGTAHAEVRALEICVRAGTLDRAHTMVVTLEPCNHAGKTPPCSDAILRTPIKRVAYGASDPNPLAQGSSEKLRAAGLEVIEGVLKKECDILLHPFRTRITTGLPWITVKTAHLPTGSMIPPPGEKTFTSPESLRLAHELRKRADAILTGSGTILADQPEFTVRHVIDHPGKSRWLVVMDRRKRVPKAWTESAKSRGFQLVFPDSVEAGLRYLGAQGCLEVLVEAGSTLSEVILSRGLWNEHYRFTRGEEGPDRVTIRSNDTAPSLL
jgi:diaminohydroxyphosphoribosylaminopyrimidine deaminase/5-amino-6-(5-phosphoribosylamino)uracil reductase